MPDLTITQDLTGGNPEFKPYPQTIFTAGIEVDCAVTNLTATETVKAILQPAKTRLKSLYYACRTAEGATGTIDVGSASDADLYGNNLDMNDTTNLGNCTITADVVTEDTWITITPNNDLDLAKFYLEATFTRVY